jgi:hypothetical protein
VSFYNNNSDDDAYRDEILKEKEEEQERYIQERYEKGVIPNYSNINNNNNNDYEIELDLSEELKIRNIIQKFINIKSISISR